MPFHEVNKPSYKSKLFVSPDHCPAMMSAMRVFLDRGDLCDVVLCAGGEEVRAHRLVLAASCPYFDAMFTSELLESRQEKIYLQGVDCEALKLLVAFIYKGEITITESNVESLLSAASLWQLVPVIKFCSDFLQEQVEADNCVGILTLADTYGCQDLFNCCQRYILHHFSDIVSTDEYVNMPEYLLVDLLRSDELHVHKEDEVLDAVLKWFRSDQDNRNLSTVLQLVRLPLIKWKVLSKKIFSDPLIANDTGCSHLFTDIENCHLHPELLAKEKANCMPRKFVNEGTRIYIVGGETHPGRSTVCSVQAYDPHKECWQQLTPMNVKRRGAGVAMLDGFLYVCGGSDGLEALRSVECYDPRSDSWSSVVDMNMERSSVAAAVIGNYLYAVGGYDGYSTCLNSVERYSFQEKKWTLVSEMNIARSMVCVGVLGKFLVAVGGYDGSSDLCSCEMYNTEADEWTVMADMNYCRCMAGVGTIDGHLYVVGGCDRAQSLNTAEVYEPDTQRWRIISPMEQPRSGLGCAVVGSELYAIGGYTSSEYCSSVECYSYLDDQWSSVINMQMGKRRFGCCS
ncbi:kelch-like protein 20 [Dysidea avara]|uniref:kelch-like protein 20 n=1 Tax=Dysidea avara TaxID=196820 RepID=UPI003331E98D